MSGQGGTKRINGVYHEGTGSPGKHRLEITSDGKWFIEYDKNHPKPIKVTNPKKDGPTHTVQLSTDVDLVEYRLTDVGDFIAKGSKKKTNSNSPGDPGDTNYDDWTGDPTSRGIGC